MEKCLVSVSIIMFLVGCGGGANSSPLTTQQEATTVAGVITPAVSGVTVNATDPSGKVVGTGSSNVDGVYVIKIEAQVEEIGRVTVTPVLQGHAFSPASQTINPTSRDYSRVIFEVSPEVFEPPPGRRSCPGDGVPDEFELPPSPGEQCNK